MFSPRIKTGAFLLEGLNAVSTTFYFYFIYWFLKAEFGFGSLQNLLWAVGSGVVYVGASLTGGRHGQRHGYLGAMRLGFATMAACFLAGWLIHQLHGPRSVEVPVQAVLMLLATVGICYTWPNLEALVSEGEPGSRLPRLIGIYNLVWSGAGAVTYFFGGALIEALGSPQVVLLLPGLMILGQYLYATSLERRHRGEALATPRDPDPLPVHGPLASEAERRRSPVPPRRFLLMSWIANPCAYLAINTAIPLIPSLAERLALDTRPAGFFCSIWLFVRTLTFVGLWRWTGWHYRFRWLVAAFLATLLGFLAVFLSAAAPSLPRSLALLSSVVAQVVFGIGIGLIYYSSLFYSMDVGDTKGHHGGIHEAAIGAGILGGPLIGTAAQYLHPGSPTAAAWAVTGVLALGLGVLAWIRVRPAPEP